MEIVLPLKGVKPSKTDILSTERYIKVSYPPYLFEIHLYSDVVEERCTARVGNGAVEFWLVKKEPGIWGRLGSEESQDRRLLGEKRAEAVERVQQVAQEQMEQRAKVKREEEQFAIRQQMKQEQEERERIEKLKQDERDRTERELQKWKEEKEKEKEKAKAQRKGANSSKHTTAKKTTEKTGVPKESSAIWKEKGKVKVPPRKQGSIQVHFTPREFPTAARESREAEEQEWLAKQAAARRITQPSEGDERDFNERNPEFLKDRGVNFFRVKNYEAAVNAFSEALSLNPSLPQLSANRASCYLAMGKLEECIDDCCRALELYYPVVPSNYTARAKVFARRGSAYAQSGRLDLATQDYEAAVKLVPGDEQLREDCARLKQALLSSDSS